MTDKSRRLVGLALLCLAVAACMPSPLGSARPSADPTPGVSPTPEPTPEPTPTPTPTPAIPDGALLPNLVMEPLTDWRVEFRDGHRLLRVTTIFSNYGDGPFELRGSRATSDQPSFLMDQVVYTASGGFRRVPTTVDVRYAGDDHNHWHAQQVVTLELSPVMDPSSVRNGNKIHFCFFDNTATNRDLPEFNSASYYSIKWCGQPSSFGVRMGLSIGWGDRYGWDFANQWIDITDVAGGTYVLEATVDWGNDFYETDDTDNCIMSRIQIPAAGEGRIITVEADSQPCPT
ncbi:MAG: lysyl oxidase family protein [Candidatus Limnocylindria bacterium]